MDSTTICEATRKITEVSVFNGGWINWSEIEIISRKGSCFLNPWNYNIRFGLDKLRRDK